MAGDKKVVGDNIYGDKIGGDKVMGDKIVAHTIYLSPTAKEPPLQLPRRAQHFHGREELIEEVLRALHPGSVVTLYGIGGIGKTAVTAEAAARVAAAKRFPEGVIFYSFYGRPATDLALEHILNSLGVERQGSLDDNTRAALGGRKLLLILDGAEEADHAGAPGFPGPILRPTHFIAQASRRLRRGLCGQTVGPRRCRIGIGRLGRGPRRRRWPKSRDL